MATEYNNINAIRELQFGSEQCAQSMFRFHAKSNPNDLTIGNLGVYYFQYGMVLKNGHIRSAKKLGLRYLLKAADISVNWQIYLNAATAAAECGNYAQALHLFQCANKSAPNELLLYNIGVCMFRLMRYTEAVEIFKQLKKRTVIKQITANGGQSPLVVLCNCSKMLKDKLGCIEQIALIPKHDYEDNLLDIFYLKHYAEMYESALCDLPELLTSWYLSPSLLATIADCISFAPQFKEIVKIPKELTKQWERFCGNRELRKRLISKYPCVPPLICLIRFVENV